MMTFLEKMSCKYSDVIQVDCWLTYQPAVFYKWCTMARSFKLNIPKHQDETTERQTDTVLQFSWLTGQDIPFP